MGRDTTTLDPKSSPYFSPTKQLDKNKNKEEFLKVTKAINENEGKSYSIDNINSLWISPYPEGEYSISYLNSSYNQAAAYIVSQKKSVVVKYIETSEKKI